MEIKYSKMTGNGNDFILIDNMDRKLSIKDLEPLVPKICARGMSLGADGFVVIEPDKSVDFIWHFYNADGSKAEMCGNAARCASRFAYLKGYCGKKMVFRTIAGEIKAEIKEGVNVKVQLTSVKDLKTDVEFRLAEGVDKYSFANTGVPHAVLFIDDIESMNVEKLGSAIRYHEHFAPKGTNVNFVKVLPDKVLRVRTYERGVEGETLACGTGSVASALIAIEKGILKSPVTILNSSGKTLIVYKEGKEMFLEGEARILTKGSILPEAYNY